MAIKKSTIYSVVVIGYFLFVAVLMLSLAFFRCESPEDAEQIISDIDLFIYQIKNGHNVLYCPEHKDIVLVKLNTIQYEEVYSDTSGCGKTRMVCPACKSYTDLYGFIAGHCYMPNCGCGLDENLESVTDCIPFIVRSEHWFIEGRGYGYCIKCNDPNAGFGLHTPRKEYEYLENRIMLQKLYEKYRLNDNNNLIMR